MQAPNQTELRALITDFCKSGGLPGDKNGIKLLSDLNESPDKKVIDTVLACWIESRDMMHAIGWLIEQGCNPLDPDQYTLSSNGVDRRGLTILSYSLRAHEKRGKILRSPQGENLVHLLCQAGPEWLGGAVVSYIDNNEDGPYLPQWFTEARHSDGKTPLHLWWDHVAEKMRSGGDFPDSPFAEFDVSEALIRAGAPLEARDQNGRSAASAMIETAEMGLAMPLLAPGVQKAQVIWEAEQLAAATPAVKRRSSGQRL